MRFAIVNQVCGAMFCDLIERFAEIAPTTVYTGEIERDVPKATILLGPKFDRSSPVSRVRTWWSFTRWSIRHAAQFGPETKCLFTSNPPFSPLPAARAKRTGAGVTALMWDIYPEAFERLKGVSKASPLSRYLRRVNRKGLRECDQVIAISEQMRVLLEQYHPLRSQIIVVPTWVDTGQIRPLERGASRFAKEHGIGDDLVVMYAGNVGEVHDLSAVPEAARLLKGVSGIRFFVIGGGSGYERLRQACLGSDVEFLPMLKSDEYADAIGVADISIVALSTKAHGISMPSKTYYAMSGGSAVCGLCSDSSDLAAVIRQHNCGFCVDPGDGQALANALSSAIQDRERVGAWKRAARQAAEAHYDADYVCSKLIEVVRNTG